MPDSVCQAQSARTTAVDPSNHDAIVKRRKTRTVWVPARVKPGLETQKLSFAVVILAIADFAYAGPRSRATRSHIACGRLRLA